MPPVAKKSGQDVTQAGSPPAGPGGDEQSLATLKAVVLAPVTIAEQALQSAPAPLFYLGAGALAVAGAVEWPVLGLVVAGTWLARRRRTPGL